MIRDNDKAHQPLRPLTGRPRRGVALLLVLGVVAATSVLSWAMLSAASLRAQLDSNVRAATESKYLADSGISYAMYYLRYPENSPVALTAGPYNKFFAGQSGLNMWEGARGLVNVAVTNTARNTFVIRSTALVDGITQTAEAEVVITTAGYVVNSAAAFGGTIQLPPLININGQVRTAGRVLSSAGASLSSVGGSPVVVETTAVPVFNELLLVKSTGITASTGGSDKTYTLNGITYIAEKAPTYITGNDLTTTRWAANPANVWYSDDSVILDNATITGTLILRNRTKSLEVYGTNTVSPKNPSLPAILVANDLKMNHIPYKSARLYANGVAYIGDKIDSSGSSSNAALSFQGGLIMGSNNPRMQGSLGTVTITKTAATDAVHLTEQSLITGITVNRWTRL